MRLQLAIAVAAVAMSACHASRNAWGATEPQNVEIPLRDGRLKAVLFRPEGPGPFPVVVGLHSCAGIGSLRNPVFVEYRDWAEQLTKAGFAVLLPDSYGSRGFGPQCSARSRVRVDRERVADAIAARVWLQQQSWVTPTHISLLGWSNGAITVLWTVRARTAVKDGPDFRSAVAFYPGCQRLTRTAWSARVPTLILIGRLDDQASAAACEQMVAGARGRSARVAIHVYPGAYHDFDHPNRAVQVRSGFAFSTDGTGRAHTGTNPAARADALKRVPEWLAQ